MTRGAAQVPALLKLRWRMLRTAGRKAGAAALLSMLPVLVVVVIVAAVAAPRQYADEAGILSPSAYLAFLVLSVIAPMSSGGGNELYPPSQLLSYPIRSATTFHASLALMPLNIAWLTNVLSLVGLTVYIVTPGPNTVLALVTVLVFALTATLLGAMTAWLAVGLRQSSAGRRLVTACGVAIVATIAAIIGTGNTTDVLDDVPTRRIVFSLLIAARGDDGPWLRRMGALMLICAAAYIAARWCCAWALRRPATTRNVEDGSKRHRMRSSHGPQRQLIAMDRASIWRSTSLRRGLMILAGAPGALAAALSLQWSEILLLPGLAAAGAGLLFGVNAFCLHGTGLVWLSSQPEALRFGLVSKAVVIAEVCGVAVLTTAIAAVVRARDEPSLREIWTLTLWCGLVVAVVVAICLHLSITRPHRADLSGHRDVPAPPGAMALYSLRLAVVTTTLSLLMSVLVRIASTSFLWITALLLGAICALSITLTVARWRDPSTRATVVTTVAAG